MTAIKRILLLATLLCLPRAAVFAQDTTRIDRLVSVRLAAAGIPSSVQCSSARLLRRMHLLLTDRIPTAAQAAAFIADPDRGRTLDSLLASEGFVEHMTLKYGDLLRIKSEFPSNLWPNAVQAYNKWLTDHFRAATPYDRMVRELLVCTGSDFRSPAVNFYRTGTRRTPQAWADDASVLFMGRRQTPEEWRAFFTQVKFKNTTEWKEEILWLDGDVLPPFAAVKMEDGAQITLEKGGDFRQPFAVWLTSQRQFARAAANRVWFWLMGRGLVEPCDDMGEGNLCPNPELLEYLTDSFIASGYDLRALVRQIVMSRTFSTSSLSVEGNRGDSLYFSHFAMRRLTAEQITDAICDVTGVADRYSSRAPEPFTNYPAGTRAAQIGDGTVTTPELDLFGRPSRDLPLESNRDNGIDAKQVLYMLNSKTIYDKLRKSPNIGQMLEGNPSPRGVAARLYLSILGRMPSQQEVEAVTEWVAGARRAATEQADGKQKGQPWKQAQAATRQAVESVAWALMNSEEFLFIN